MTTHAITHAPVGDVAAIGGVDVAPEDGDKWVVADGERFRGEGRHALAERYHTVRVHLFNDIIPFSERYHT